MTAPLEVTWSPGSPLPRRANRITLAAILRHELGVTVGPRFAEQLDVRPTRIAGQNTWPVDAALKAVRRGGVLKRKTVSKNTNSGLFAQQKREFSHRDWQNLSRGNPK